MGAWRTPVAISIALHGAAGVWMLVAEPDSDASRRSEPIAMEIRVIEPPPPPVVEPEPPADEPEPPVDPPVTPRKPASPKPVAPGPKPAPAPSPEPPQAPLPAPSAAPKPSDEGVVIINPGAGEVRDLSKIDLSVPALSVRGRSGPQLVPPPVSVRIERPSGPKLVPTEEGGYAFRDSQFSAIIAPDGSVTFRDKTSAADRIKGFSVQIDITDEIMRGMGDDPYRYEKQKFMKQTAALRAEMAEEACKTRLSNAIDDLGKRLNQAWDRPGVPVAQRRRLLFKLWDECAEDGNEDVLRHAIAARQTIIAFIRVHLPSGHPDAFPPDELEALNGQRVSRERFDPYVE